MIKILSSLSMTYIMKLFLIIEEHNTYELSLGVSYILYYKIYTLLVIQLVS